MDSLVEFVKYYVLNFWRNLTGIFDGMNSTRWIRMIAAVGAYFLLRPYLVRIGERIQQKQYEKTMREGEKKMGPKAKISPNALRGQVEPIQEEDEGEEEVVKGGEPGKKARKRQVKKVTQQQDENDQVYIMDHLVDFVEGEDGW